MRVAFALNLSQVIYYNGFLINYLHYFGYRNGYVFLKQKQKCLSRFGYSASSTETYFRNHGSLFVSKNERFQLIQKLYKDYPEVKYFGLYVFQIPAIVIRDPEIIKSVAIKNFEIFPDHRGFTDVRLDPLFGIALFSLKGDAWRDMRNILSPSFTSSKMKIMFNLMMECSVKFTDALLERSKDKNYIVNLKDVFTRLSADAISSCAFGISIDSMRDPENKLYIIGRKATNFEGILSIEFLLIRICRMISRRLKPKIRITKIENCVFRKSQLMQFFFLWCFGYGFYSCVLYSL